MGSQEKPFDGKPIPAAEFLAKHPMPVILQHQVQSFTVLTSESDLKRWENDLVTKVGLSPDLAAQIRSQMRAIGGTTTDCGGAGASDIDR